MYHYGGRPVAQGFEVANPTSGYSQVNAQAPPIQAYSSYRTSASKYLLDVHEAPANYPAGTEQRRVVPFGMRPVVFAAIFLLGGILIGGAIVGGVVGSVMASRVQTAKESAVAATTTEPPAPTTTSFPGPSEGPFRDYTTPPTKDIETLQLSCPRLDGTSFTGFDGKRFNIVCGVDENGPGREAVGEIKDVSAFVAYSFQDCLNACTTYNRLSGRDPARPSSLICRAAVFRRSLNDNIALREGGNCFLKNATRASGNPGRPNTGLLTGQLL
ncbi:uncharacterized protein PpBr36_06181 [Pyricularia pennisetigena]|uniref:uncharacterized protein n=1 Tax=Pyricularia pennisetigena TaxID=1578925 RepID=UPI00114D91F5|nr:uncharacterized protein PpBr36_06181 [Pyricularia pennisetigena]TLS22784.1 hypothetical protein PpBr36_06181 [Pyricularia pennisetigena]